MFREKYVAFMKKIPKSSKVEEGIFFIAQIYKGVERKEIIDVISELRGIKQDSAKLYVTRSISAARRAGHAFDGKPISGKDRVKMSEKTEEFTSVEVLSPEESNTVEKNSVEEQRKLDELAESIRNFTFQVRDNIINIGQCFIEAKELVKHGEWVKWIKANTTFTRQTVYKFIQCTERFANVALAKRLNDTQMMELLALPKTQTEEFLKAKEDEGNPVEGMTKKELRSEIKSWNTTNSAANGNIADDINDNKQKFRIVKLKVHIGKEEELVKILKDALTVEDYISDENKDVLQKVIETLSTSSEAEKQEDVPA